MEASDQEQQFDWDKVRKSVREEKGRITELKEKIMSTQLSFFELKVGCDFLKQKLTMLIIRLEEELMVAQKYVDFEANKLKNAVLGSVLAKHVMKMNIYIKILVGISALVFVASTITLGLELAGLISLTTQVTVKLTSKIVVRYVAAFSGLGILLGFALDFGISWWKAKQNKQNFLNLISMVQNALKELVQSRK